MNWRELRVVAFDVETTGLNVHDGDRVIEFAAVEFRVGEDGRPVEVSPSSFLFNPGIPIPRKVVELTGISDEEVRSAPRFEDRAEELHRLLADAICVAHNLPFDRGFLGVEMRRAGLDWPDPPGEVDTLDLAQKLYPTAPSHRLADVAELLGVPLARAHRATDDAEACGRVFLEMARRHDAPERLEEMLAWAGGLGEPPPNDVFVRGPGGAWHFASGPHAGEPIAHHPDHLHWMTLALERVLDRWHPRHPEALRAWCATWLRVRGAGRVHPGGRAVGPEDHVVDSGAVRPWRPGQGGAATG